MREAEEEEAALAAAAAQAAADKAPQVESVPVNFLT